MRCYILWRTCSWELKDKLSPQTERDQTLSHIMPRLLTDDANSVKSADSAAQISEVRRRARSWNSFSAMLSGEGARRASVELPGPDSYQRNSVLIGRSGYHLQEGPQLCSECKVWGQSLCSCRSGLTSGCFFTFGMDNTVDKDQIKKKLQICF